MKIAIQDTYPDDVAHCYGCGSLNEAGHQIKTVLEGDETVTEFTPEPYHTAIPGYIYGGLIASLIDCHSTGSAAIYAMRNAGTEVGSEQAPRFVTAHLEVDFLAPTPMGSVRLVGHAVEVKDRKVVVTTDFFAGGKRTAKGSAVLVKMPEDTFL
ncbi:MAG: PaaI family thioesterase [Gammaproteobacteria bacterium]|nr:PaaI family thioesterase [Gammaproteobacteria bacterium]